MSVCKLYGGQHYTGFSEEFFTAGSKWIVFYSDEMSPFSTIV